MKEKKLYLLIVTFALVIITSYIFIGIAMSTRILINREVFFGNPDRISVRISPDGRYISCIAPLNGVLNIYVAPIDNITQAKPITNDKNRGITSYNWTYKDDTLVYMQDTNGDENFHQYKVNLKTNKITDISPFDKVRSYLVGASIDYPSIILIALNNRNPDYHDIYQYHLDTDELKLLLQNDKYSNFVVNNELKIVYASIMAQDTGDVEIFDISNIVAPRSFMKIPSEDSNTTNIIGFNHNADKLYYVDSRNRDMAGLFQYDTQNAVATLLAENPHSDINGNVMLNPLSHEIEGYSTEYIRRETFIINDAIRSDFDYLKTKEKGEMYLVSRSIKDNKWLIAYATDTGPYKYYLFDRLSKKNKFLFVTNTALSKEESKLSPMDSVVIRSRDNLELISYFTLPKIKLVDGKIIKPLPLVLLVHGGPRARDSWGYNPQHQWLANRGYVVLSVNYRGSTGFGKKFIKAGNGQWAGKMHEDLIDAVNWAVKKGYADKDKIAIFGGSYGGYAALVGLTFTPDFFACGVDLVGPSNLITLINSIPSYWKPFKKSLIEMIGENPDTEQGKEFLQARSPLTFVSNINKPLLIGQGANDPRVTQIESDQIVTAMKNNKIPVTYALYPDEGHGFTKPNNRISFYAITEEFLGKTLNMPYQEIGASINNSSVVVTTSTD